MVVLENNGTYNTRSGGTVKITLCDEGVHGQVFDKDGVFFCTVWYQSNGIVYDETECFADIISEVKQ